MKLRINLKLAALVGVLVAIPLLSHGGGKLSAAAAPRTPSPAPTQKTPQAPKPATNSYSYVAQPGDSYSKLARKAVQTYGKKFNIKLSEAKIIFAETNLTQTAGAPHLEINQKIDIPEATLKQWVDQAAKLPTAAEAAWAYYVQFADFNTDHVGQARR